MEIRLLSTVPLWWSPGLKTAYGCLASVALWLCGCPGLKTRPTDACPSVPLWLVPVSDRPTDACPSVALWLCGLVAGLKTGYGCLPSVTLWLCAARRSQDPAYGCLRLLWLPCRRKPRCSTRGSQSRRRSRGPLRDWGRPPSSAWRRRIDTARWRGVAPKRRGALEALEILLCDDAQHAVA